MVGTQQFNLRWNNHTSNILQVFLEHLSSESLVDVTLSSEGKFIKAHKIVLSACSPYFQEVFAKHTDKEPLIILNGIRFEDLRSMIKFMYNGEIRVHETELEALLAAAETLQVKGLSNVRSKYERGEITSLTPVVQKSVSKVSQSPPITQDAPSVNSIKGPVALFAPTVVTSRAPDNVSSALPVATPECGGRAKPVSANLTARASSNVSKSSGKAISIAPRPPPAPISALAFATILPTVPSTMIPGASTANPVRAVVPILPRPATSLPSMSSATTIKFSAFSAITTGTTTMSSSVIPIDTTKIGSVYSTVKSVDRISRVSKDTTSVETNSSLDKNCCNPVTEISRVPINPTPASSSISVINEETEKKPAESEAPRVRKRRKMSHIVVSRETLTSDLVSRDDHQDLDPPITSLVNDTLTLRWGSMPSDPTSTHSTSLENELAKEAVFTSNGRVLLEPDKAVLRTNNKNSITVRTDLSDSAEIVEIAAPSQARNLRVNIQSKQPQESLLIKRKDRETKEPVRIPRPLNAFMIFANEWRRRLAAENPTESNTTISVRLGKMWKSLSVETKEAFYRRAQIADEVHQQKYPGYYYSPREARMRKNSKHDKTLTKCLSISSKNLDELRMIKAYVNGEKRTSDEESYAFESDEDYGDEEENDNEEQEEDDYDDEEEDDVILEYSADEEEPEEKPNLNTLANNTKTSTKLIQ